MPVLFASSRQTLNGQPRVHSGPKRSRLLSILSGSAIAWLCLFSVLAGVGGIAVGQQDGSASSSAESPDAVGSGQDATPVPEALSIGGSAAHPGPPVSADMLQPQAQPELDPDGRGEAADSGDEATNASTIEPAAIRSDSVADQPNDAGGVTESLTDQGSSPKAWPEPAFLLGKLARLESHPQLRTWAADVAAKLAGIRSMGHFDDPQIEPLLSDLARLINAVDPLIVASSTVPVESLDQAAGPLAAELRSIRHHLIQHWTICGSAYRLATLAPQFTRSGTLAVPVVRVAHERLAWPEFDPQWTEYLKIDALRATFEASGNDVKARRLAAQKFLTRLTAPVLDDQQRQFLASQLDPALIETLRGAAGEAIDLHETLQTLDDWQATRAGYQAARLARAMQGLAWQDDEASQLLVAAMNDQLRAPNLRLSVSDEMLNRMLPASQELAAPVNENVLGADVRGHSRIANRLQIRLIPDPEQIQLRLEAIGLVRSRTEASQKGFTIDNVGDSRFQVLKRLAIGRNGIQSDRPSATASSSSQVVGMRSPYDGFPVLGWMARKMASRQIAERAPLADRLVESRIKAEASQRMELEIDQQLTGLQTWLTTSLIEPLTALELEPEAVEMRSTHDRILMQYRMAGRDQLAAGSSRPMGLQGSLMSMQLHESLINNMLARIELAGRSYTGDELAAHLATIFGPQAKPDDKFANTTYKLEFAPYDPVALHFDNGQCVIELNLRSLKVGRGKAWKNLTVRATYAPVVTGDRLRMIQDESGISLQGNRQLTFRDQTAIRAIFTALFRGQYEIALLPPGITERLGSPVAMSQFELADGWLALSMDLAGAPATLAPASAPDRPSSHQSDRGGGLLRR